MSKQAAPSSSWTLAHICNNLECTQSYHISSEPSAGPTWFAQKLEEKAFIANAADAVVLGYTSYQQTSRLMSAIKGKISTSQEPGRVLSQFLEVLESNPQSVDLARELRM